MYVSAETRRLQSSFRDRIFATSGPCATHTIRCDVRGQTLEASWSLRLEWSCRNPSTHTQSLQLLQNHVLEHSSAQILTQQTYTMILQERKGVKLIPLLPSRDCSALTRALKPSDVHGTSLILSPGLSAHCETSLYPHQKTTRL